MGAFRPFELQAIALMATGVLSESQLALLRRLEAASYEYTGSGYYLKVSHPSLPQQTKTLSEPAVIGAAGDIQAGFVVYLDQHQLTLECHTWGAVDVPGDFRDRQVQISTPPVKTGRGNAT